MTFSWSPPAPTERNGVITGYSLSCVSEVGGERSSITMQYTAAGTFTLRGFTPFTSYNCSISASNSRGSGPMIFYINTTLEACKLHAITCSTIIRSLGRTVRQEHTLQLVQPELYQFFFTYHMRIVKNV